MDLPRYGQPDGEYAMRLAATDPADDGPIWMVNLMKYRERADYADGRETELTGQVRFNTFPSLAAFLHVVSDPARLEAQRTNREAAIADTYTLVTRPVIDSLAESVTS